MEGIDLEAVAAAIADEQGRPVTAALRDDVTTAAALVAQEISGQEHRFTHPAARQILTRAIAKCAIELSDQRDAPSGIRNFSDVDSVVAVRVARDPMVAARPLLAPFLPLATS